MYHPDNPRRNMVHFPEDVVQQMIAEAIRNEREACAAHIESIRMDEILLAGGEMTAQERRTIKALQPWFAHRIRNR